MKRNKKKGYWASVRRGAAIGAAIVPALGASSIMNDPNTTKAQKAAYLGTLSVGGALSGAGAGGLLGVRKRKTDSKQQKRTKNYAAKGALIGGATNTALTGLGLLANSNDPEIRRNSIRLLASSALSGGSTGALVGGGIGSGVNRAEKRYR